MKQILQNLGTGETLLAEIPEPSPRAGALIIRSQASLVSLGTEKMLIDFGRAGWIDKALKQPEKVKQVLQKIKTDGIIATLDAVQAKLDQPIALGYSNVGVIVDGSATLLRSMGCQIGDRVVSNGPHAEVVCVPKNLCAKVPTNVSDEAASFTVVGAIALQGIRLAAPTLGETVAVIGLGLIGLLTVQLLQAHGCRVVGIDFDPWKCQQAAQMGAETVNLAAGADAVACALEFTKGRGVDAVLITASTKSNDPVRQAAQMSRKRGRIILIGVTGLQLSRSDFYEKELSFQVSCSYGPGRYDDEYENAGKDYPFGFVRWTEQRNFESFLDLVQAGRINPVSLITHRFDFINSLNAYADLGKAQALGIILRYGSTESSPRSCRTIETVNVPTKRTEHKVCNPKSGVIGLIGAGNFSGATLLPALRMTDARLKTIASGAGVTGTHLAKKFRFEQSTTDTSVLLSDPEIDTIMVATRHDSHARFILQSLDSGKRIYVEKPLCLTNQELAEIEAKVEATRGAFVMVGFNRRFAPLIKKIKPHLLSRPEPKAFIFVANAGAIPSNHWTQDRKIGGGRIIGEACHYIDLLRHLAGHEITEHKITRAKGFGAENGDVATISLAFRDGSIGSVHYLANGTKSYPKESLKIFCGGSIIEIENFRRLRAIDWKGLKDCGLWRQDKGHAQEMRALIEAVRSGGASPVPFKEAVEVTRIAIALEEQC